MDLSVFPGQVKCSSGQRIIVKFQEGIIFAEILPHSNHSHGVMFVIKMNWKNSCVKYQNAVSYILKLISFTLFCLNLHGHPPVCLIWKRERQIRSFPSASVSNKRLLQRIYCRIERKSKRGLNDCFWPNESLSLSFSLSLSLSLSLLVSTKRAIGQVSKML